MTEKEVDDRSGRVWTAQAKGIGLPTSSAASSDRLRQEAGRLRHRRLAVPIVELPKSAPSLLSPSSAGLSRPALAQRRPPELHELAAVRAVLSGAAKRRWSQPDSAQARPPSEITWRTVVV
jgi:hypothetical protein